MSIYHDFIEEMDSSVGRIRIAFVANVAGGGFALPAVGAEGDGLILLHLMGYLGQRGERLAIKAG